MAEDEVRQAASPPPPEQGDVAALQERHFNWLGAAGLGLAATGLGLVGAGVGLEVRSVIDIVGAVGSKLLWPDSAARIGFDAAVILVGGPYVASEGLRVISGAAKIVKSAFPEERER